MKMEKDFILTEIDRYSDVLNTIKKLISSGVKPDLSKALLLTSENGLEDIYNHIKQLILEDMTEIVNTLDLEMPLFDLSGDYRNTFNIEYKGEGVAYFLPESGLLKVVNREERIRFYKMVKEKTGRKDVDEKIRLQEESVPIVELLAEEMKRQGYDIGEDI